MFTGDEDLISDTERLVADDSVAAWGKVCVFFEVSFLIRLEVGKPLDTSWLLIFVRVVLI